MRYLTCVLSSLLLATAAFAQDAPPRLSDLKPPLPADFAQARQASLIGQYAGAQVRHLQLKAGAEMASHAAPARALVIVISGRGQFDFSGEIVPLHERQVLHMSPGEPHAVSAETDLELLVVLLPADA